MRFIESQKNKKNVSVKASPHTLASPAMEHWGTCPLYFQLFIFFWSLQSRMNTDIGLYAVAYPEIIYRPIALTWFIA